MENNKGEVFKYPTRNDIVYTFFDRSERNSTRTMFRCGECKTKFKVRGKKIICPKCERDITEETVVKLEGKDYKFFNIHTTMFIDDDIVTISMLITNLSRYNRYYPIFGKENARLKVRLNLTKKTALAYMVDIDLSTFGFSNIRLPSKYYNATQPILNPFKNMDIKLPKELIVKFYECLNLEYDENEVVTLDMLPWINRLRKPMKEIKRQRAILKSLVLGRDNSLNDLESDIERYEFLWDLIGKSKDVDDDELIEIGHPFYKTKTLRDHKNELEKLKMEIEERNHRYLALKRGEGRVKRFLKSNHKPKGYDENTFQALCLAKEVDRNSIPKEFEKHYYLNPESLGYVREHNILFHNRDVRINAIVTAEENYYFGLRGNVDKTFRDDAIMAFGNVLELDNLDERDKQRIEVNIFKKIEKCGDYSLLYDTVNMILQIRKQGLKFKTKGNLNYLHDKASKMMNLIKAPDVEFENTMNKEDIVISKKEGDYRFIFAKKPKELIEVGNELDICVGSYYNYCIYSDVSVVYVKKDEKVIACLEFDNTMTTPRLTQAKGYKNMLLKRNIQRIVADFCFDIGARIYTRDINYEIMNEHNDIIEEVFEKIA